MKENLILEQNLYEAAEMLRSNKRMIKLTYAERVYLQQWIYEKTGNRISSQKCDLEAALYLFYEAKKPKEKEKEKEVVVDEQIIDEIIENSEVTEKQTTTTKPTSKKSTTNKNSKK